MIADRGAGVQREPQKVIDRWLAFVEAVNQAKSEPGTVQIKRMSEAEALSVFGRSRYGRSLSTDSIAGRDVIAAGYAFGLITSDPYRDFLAAHPNLNDTPDTKAAFNAMQGDKS